MAIFVITLAIFVSIVKALTPWAKQYKPQVEQRLSMLLGQNVHIEGMETGWYWLEPVIKLKQITIDGETSHPLKLEKLLVGINVFSSLWHWQLQPGILYIDNVHLVLKEQKGTWQINGVSSAGNVNKMDPEVLEHFVSWLSLQEKLVLKHVSASLLFSDGHRLELTAFDLKAVNDGGRYHVQSEARLEQSSAKLLADFYLDPYHLDHTDGKFFIEFNKVYAEQIQSFFPEKYRVFKKGSGQVKSWIDVENGKISSAQAQVDLKDVDFKLVNNKHQTLPSLQANLAFEATEQGWVLTGDQIKLKTKDISWPVNQFQVRYHHLKNEYQVYVKSIVLESLMKETINWYQPVASLKTMQAHGNLHDTKVTIQDGQPKYLLTQFSQLGWQPDKKCPGMNHLAGVIHWQPDSGHLELDSKNVLVAVKNYPDQTFSVINAAFDWKNLSHGTRLSIERLFMVQPDLTLSAQGVLDDLRADTVGHVHLISDLSAKNIHRWLPSLPDHAFKPKLVKWLKTNIKQVDQLNGHLILNGRFEDFPFDKQPGTFKFTSHLSGAQVKINPEWPLIKDIDGYLNLDKRTLNINLMQANINGVPVKGVNLKINELGYDKETLLVHGQARGQADKFTSFVMASPLKDKLSMLKRLTIQGLMNLDLKLQIPLYEGDEPILARGRVHLDDDTIQVQHRVGNIELKNMKGQLDFDEKGIVDSALVATAFGYPFNLSVQSVKEPEPYTLLTVKSQITMDELRKQYDLPLFEFVKGQTQIESQLKITPDPNDMDHLHLQSSMKGIYIDLPPPFAKLSQREMPLSADLDFNPQKGAHLRVNYGHQVSGDLVFDEDKGAFNLYSGEIRLGGGKALKQSQPGLRVLGQVSHLDLDKWRIISQKLSDNTQEQGLLSHLNFIDIKLKKALAWGNTFNDLTFKAYKTKKEEWTLSIDQKKVLAKLHYQPLEHHLTGNFKRLELNFSESNQQGKSKDHQTPSPEQIPNLDVQVNNFHLNNYNLGQLILKSHSEPDQWVLDQLLIGAPSYEMRVNGQWVQKDKKNNTSLHARLSIDNLSETLRRFNIDPVVEAEQGDLDFKGGWSGSLFDYSLSALQGNMTILFNNGRITNLSKETEEKMGLGKLLSILSLQTIPRRLKLDFSDLSQKGYSFDVFKGHFKMANGKMTTRDSYIDGPVAYASMNGQLDLKKRLYAIELKISPHITASLPVVATIAGGPIAGIATWVASKIINQGMQKISAYTYKVSGPWHKPVVQQVNIIRRQP